MAREAAVVGKTVKKLSHAIGRCVVKRGESVPVVFGVDFSVFADPLEDPRLSNNGSKIVWEEDKYEYVDPSRCSKAFKYIEACERAEKMLEAAYVKLVEKRDKDYPAAIRAQKGYIGEEPDAARAVRIQYLRDKQRLEQIHKDHMKTLIEVIGQDPFPMKFIGIKN